MTEPQFPEWLTRDIRPADGWRAAYFVHHDPEGMSVKPLAGWLVQVVEFVSINSFEPIPGQPPLDKRARRIVAGVANEYGVVEAVDEMPDCDCQEFWRLLAPGEEIPDREDVIAGFEQRRLEHERHRLEHERHEFDAIAAKLRDVEDPS